MRKFLINSPIWIKCNHGLTLLLYVFKFNVRIICTYQGVLRIVIMTYNKIFTIYSSFQGGGLLFLNEDCNYAIVFYLLSKSVGHISRCSLVRERIHSFQHYLVKLNNWWDSNSCAVFCPYNLLVAYVRSFYKLLKINSCYRFSIVDASVVLCTTVRCSIRLHSKYILQ